MGCLASSGAGRTGLSRFSRNGAGNLLLFVPHNASERIIEDNDIPVWQMVRILYGF